MNQRDTLLSLLQNRQDQEALVILKENRELCDNTVCRYALDNRCFACIGFLRQNGYITLEGKEERDEARLRDMEKHMETYYKLMDEVCDYMEQREDTTNARRRD